MRKKRGGESGGGANWMDTYGDMVTLLLCFFVMLYSMSSVDAEKYAALAESFNPDANPDATHVPVNPTTEPDTPLTPPPTVEEAAQAMDQLYEDLVDFFIEEDMGSNVSISKGSGYVFISFHDAIFFDGNSYTLRDEGKLVLDRVAESIGDISNTVNVIEILGHTARVDSEDANIISTDRYLASNRATSVTVYLQQKGVIDPSRLVSIGYGEWRPIGDNAEAEGQASNRRVELVISGYNAESIDKDDVTLYYDMHEQASEPEQVDTQEEQDTDSTDTQAQEDTADTADTANTAQEEPQGEEE